jgi:hypothetical protein
MLPPGTRFSKAQLSREGTQDVMREPFAPRERGNLSNVEVAALKLETIMRHKLHLAVLIAITLVGAAASASAQGPGTGTQIGTTPGTGNVPPVGAPSNPASVTPAPGGTTGLGTRPSANVNPTHNVQGVPDTSTPGRFGADAAPSGLPGDDPAHPGHPKMGR